MTAPAAPHTTEDVTIFYADWCPFCSRLIKALNRTQTPHALVDVEGSDADSINAWIESVNDGNRTIPAVLYSDGTHAINPAASEVRAKLAELTGESAG